MESQIIEINLSQFSKYKVAFAAASDPSRPSRKTRSMPGMPQGAGSGPVRQAHVTRHVVLFWFGNKHDPGSLTQFFWNMDELDLALF